MTNIFDERRLTLCALLKNDDLFNISYKKEHLECFEIKYDEKEALVSRKKVIISYSELNNKIRESLKEERIKFPKQSVNLSKKNSLLKTIDELTKR